MAILSNNPIPASVMGFLMSDCLTKTQDRIDSGQDRRYGPSVKP